MDRGRCDELISGALFGCLPITNVTFNNHPGTSEKYSSPLNVTLLTTGADKIYTEEHIYKI